MDYRSKFLYWYFNEFQLTELYQNMVGLSEDSPWHRERNIATHTDMVVSSYLAFAPNPWTYETLVGALACAFHDVGKPSACEKNGIKFKPERGHYKSFGGHEQMSARMWENWAASNFEALEETFIFQAFDIYRVGWIIEKHLPWGIKKTDKLHNMATTCLELFSDTGTRTFTDMLLADTYGRMSDDYIEKRQKVHSWIEGFDDLAYGVMNSESHKQIKDRTKILYMPIAASGAGKSTFVEGMLERAKDGGHATSVFSWDQLRLDWYITSEEWLGVQTQADAKIAYGYAYERACEDKEFNNKANKRFVEMLKTGEHVIVDNTNLSKKRRRFFVDQAKRHGYYVIAVLLPIALDEVIARQEKRRDKNVPIPAVKQHYMSVQLPEYGEVDDVWVINDNLYLSTD